MSFLKKIFGTKPGGSFVGNLFRSAVKMVPIVGGAVGGALDASFEKKQQALADKSASEAIAKQQPTVDNVMSNGGFPDKSSIFQQGQADNPYMLNEVKISPQRQSTNIDLDWKNGRIKYDTNPNASSNNMLMFGLLGLGAVMLLKK